MVKNERFIIDGFLKSNMVHANTCRRFYISEMPVRHNMAELDAGQLELLSNAKARYAIVGDAGIQLRLGKNEGALEILANESVDGIRILKQGELGPLEIHYQPIIDTAEEVTVGGYKLRVATVPYLIAESIARKKFPFALIKLAESGKIDRQVAEDVRGLLKATGLREEWTEFLQLLYDFAPNALR